MSIVPMLRNPDLVGLTLTGQDPPSQGMSGVLNSAPWHRLKERKVRPGQITMAGLQVRGAGLNPTYQN